MTFGKDFYLPFFVVGGDGFVLVWFYARFSFFCLFALLQGNWTTQRKTGVCVKGEKGTDKEWASASDRKDVGARGNMREEM